MSLLLLLTDSYVDPETDVYPDPADVRVGVQYGPNGNDYEGTCVLPLPSVVLSGISIDHTVGTLTLPLATQTLTGVIYGVGGSSLTGTVSLPTASVVQYGVTFGPSGGNTGTYDPISGNFTDPGVTHVEVGVIYQFAGNTLTGTFSGSSGFPTVDQIASAVVATPEFRAVKAAVYDSVTVVGSTLTLSTGATQVVTNTGRQTAGV